MGTFDDDPAKDGLQSEEAHNETLLSESGTLIAGSSVGTDHLADFDLLAAMTPVSSDALDGGGETILSAMTSVAWDGSDSIGHTLDQLTSATNLFDVPPLDLDTPTVS